MHGNPETPILKVSKLSVSLGNTAILTDISFHVNQGAFLGIMGPNGAGKSTLIKTLLNQIRPVSGEVSFWNRSFRQAKSKISYIPQRDAVDWNFPINVKQVAQMGRFPKLPFWKKLSPEDHKIVDHALATVELTEYQDAPIHVLSGGQRQRLFLARALAQEAELLILDEPFAGVDAVTNEKLFSIFKTLSASGKTILCVHHDLNQASKYFEEILLINRKLIDKGSPEQVFSAANLHEAYGLPVEILGY